MLEKKELEAELANLNGVYIPGDTKGTFMDMDYVFAVGSIMSWAQEHQNDLSKHFPVVGVSYGYLAMLRSQLRNDEMFDYLPRELTHTNLQQNLNLMPNETFTYDEKAPMDLEQLFDEIDFYNELEFGLTLDSFKYL